MTSLLTSCLILATLLLAAKAAPADGRVSYEGYRVVRIVPDTEAALAALQTILKDPLYADTDVWLEPSHPGIPVDVNVPPQMYSAFINALDARTLSHTVMVDNVQAKIDIEKEGIRVSRRQLGNSIVGSYVPYADILSWLSDMAKTNPKVAVQSYGLSLENRTMTVAKISKPSGSQKPIVFIEAGIHAREWISPATSIWIINELATSTDPEIAALLNAADWYVVPVANPDGYEYTQATDRLWRKNRSVNKNSTCRGVDLNRNWDSHWMEVGASSDPCDDTYAGSAPFSEPETKLLSNAISGLKENIKAFVSLHSYSQLWLTPWAYTKNPPIDNALLMDVANKGASALQAVNGTVYKVGSPALILYAAAGGSFDWVKEKAGVQFSYTLELRDTGKYGFLLPVDQIIPTGTETWVGIKTVVKLILKM